MKTSHELVNQDSGSTEWYTPPEIIAAAARTLGGFDLDPASSLVANERVKAVRIFTEADDGLARDWFGRVWMNHPFKKRKNHLWINKLEREFTSGRVLAACCITYAATSERWFQPLLARPQCFLCPRTNYFLPDGTKKPGVTKGSAVTYFGREVERFAAAFRDLGTIKIPA